MKVIDMQGPIRAVSITLDFSNDDDPPLLKPDLAYPIGLAIQRGQLKQAEVLLAEVFGCKPELLRIAVETAAPVEAQDNHRA